MLYYRVSQSRHRRKEKEKVEEEKEDVGGKGRWRRIEKATHIISFFLFQSYARAVASDTFMLLP